MGFFREKRSIDREGIESVINCRETALKVGSTVSENHFSRENTAEIDFVERIVEG